MAIEFRRTGPWQLPDTWLWARLGDLADFVGRGQGPRYVEERGIPVVNQKCIRWRRFEDQHLRLTDRAVFERLPSQLHIRRGDILWNSTGTGTIGRALVYDGHIPEATVDSHITIVRLRGIDPHYVCSFIETMRVQRLVANNNVGSTNQLELPRSFIEDLLIPIPPKLEQQRIIAKIEEMFTEVVDGEMMLEGARDDLARWRRAIMKAAVTGEITRHWREHRRPNEMALDILDELRSTRINRRLDKHSGRFGSRASNEFPKLPESWEWTLLGEIAESIRNGTSQVPRAERNQNEILRISSVRPMFIDLSQIRYLTDKQAEVAESFKAKFGDLLFTRYNGSTDLVGVGALYRDAPRFYPDKLIRVRLWPELRDYADFLEVAVNTWVSRRHIASHIKTTAGQQGISGESLKATPIPLPPQKEAAEIVARLQAPPEHFDHGVKRAITASRQIRQSILKAAFEGRLAEHNPGDESAEMLLTRLFQHVRPRRHRRRGPEFTLPLFDFNRDAE